MDFPQYRKLSNRRSFYRIESSVKFTEVQIMGSKRFVHSVEARQYPEKLRIMDMLNCEPPFELSDRNEFDSMNV
jgi:hypothetical protein